MLREIQETAEEVISEEFGSRVTLLDENGVTYDKSALTPQEDLKGMIFNESTEYDINTGVEVISDRPVVSLAIRHLTRVPEAGEKWMVSVQLSPFSEDMTSFMLSGPPKNAKTIGFINLRLQKLSQN